MKVMKGGEKMLLKMIYGCIILIILDVILGLYANIGQIKSSIMRKGLWHKGGELLALGASYLMSNGLFTPLHVDLPTLEIIAPYIAVMECVSIWENIKKFVKVGEDDEKK